MIERFINRKEELTALDKVATSGGLVVVYGRRRVGKTRLLRRWLEHHHGLYAQAIEGNSLLQLDQIFQDVKSDLETPVTPRTWDDFLSILDHQKNRLVLCLDEFPYLVQADSTLPSRLQRWWDHRSNKNLLMVLCGSSRRMMHDALLNETSPLYGRSQLVLNVKPMGYRDFCRVMTLKADRTESFRLFSLVGGIPRYWELIQKELLSWRAADSLYFGYASYMENEPRRLLADEQIRGTSPVSVLEAVGRGASKPSEIAARLGVAQTQMAKVLYVLLDFGFLRRDIPLGQSERNPKNVLYSVGDPSLRFWYKIYSPHKSRWHTYSTLEKEQLLNFHASSVFEDYVRSRFPGAGRYWEKVGEFDMVRPAGKGVIVAEIKFRSLTQLERSKLLSDLKARWFRTEASRRWSVSRFEVIDTSFLAGYRAVSRKTPTPDL